MILVAGDFIIDSYMTGEVERICPEAPVPVINCHPTIDRRLGGAGNVVANLIKMMGGGYKIGFITAGSFSDYNFLMSKVEESGVGVHWLPTASVPEKIRYVSESSHLILRADKNEHLERNVVKEAFSVLSTRLENWEDIAVLVIVDYGKGFWNNQWLREELLYIAAQNNIKVVVATKTEYWGGYEGADLIVSNEKEAEKANPGKVAERLILEMGLREGIVVTKGSQGMSVCTKKGCEWFPLENKVDVIDVTGAGDVVTAVFALGEYIEMPLDECAKAANATASEAVKMRGTVAVDIAEAYRDLWRAKTVKKELVFTNGVFDLLHDGHRYLLKRAKEMGKRLVVAVNSDEAVSKLKGAGRPVQNLNARMAQLRALPEVDFVVPFKEDTPENIIRLLRPSVIVKGGDYMQEEVVGHDFCKEWSGEVKIVPLVPGVSTTQILRGREVGGDG